MRQRPGRGILDRMAQALQPSPRRREKESRMSVNATAPIASSSPSANEQTPGPRHGDRPTWVERIAETAPIIDAPAYFGPPVSFVLGPWLLLLLLLIGPAALLITLVLAFVLAAGALAALVALLASPYLLVR